jgi:hypothetical protein
VTGLAGCALNAFEPFGLIAGVGSGIGAAYVLDVYHMNAAKNEYNNTVNNVCAALPDKTT